MFPAVEGSCMPAVEYCHRKESNEQTTRRRCCCRNSPDVGIRNSDANPAPASHHPPTHPTALHHNVPPHVHPFPFPCPSFSPPPPGSRPSPSRNPPHWGNSARSSVLRKDDGGISLAGLVSVVGKCRDSRFRVDGIVCRADEGCWIFDQSLE